MRPSRKDENKGLHKARAARVKLGGVSRCTPAHKLPSHRRSRVKLRESVWGYLLYVRSRKYSVTNDTDRSDNGRFGPRSPPVRSRNTAKPVWRLKDSLQREAAMVSGIARPSGRTRSSSTGSGPHSTPIWPPVATSNGVGVRQTQAHRPVAKSSARRRPRQ